MSADFWASYLSGAAGIVIGNPLDIVKVQLQVGKASKLVPSSPSRFAHLSRFTRGSAAPILGYGALNSLLFVSYNRTLSFLDSSITDYTNLSGVSLDRIWLAGFVGGLASWVVSAPSELVKCRTQLAADGRSSSLVICKRVWKTNGLRGLYTGGTVTSLRDAVGYGFYFWSYEISKRWMSSTRDTNEPKSLDVLLSGGIAGMVTWTSIYPLDVLKTRIQALEGQRKEIPSGANRRPDITLSAKRSIIRTTSETIHSEGLHPLYRGLGVCNLRAFGVNAIQWYIYETIMNVLK